MQRVSPIKLYSDEVKARVPIREAVRRYAPGMTWRGGQAICCPFHAEKTPSMRLFEDHFHCFGCGAHGDVIDLVGRLLGIGAQRALETLNTDFGLYLPICKKPTLSQMARSSRQAKDMQLERKRADRAKQARREAYWNALDELARLEANKQDYAPRTMEEAWHPLFEEALRNIAYQKRLVEELWMEI